MPSGLMGTHSEYIEPWLQQTRGILSLNSSNISALKNRVSDMGENAVNKTESSHFVDHMSCFFFMPKLMLELTP